MKRISSPGSAAWKWQVKLALSAAGQECVWLQRVISDLSVSQSSCVVFEDNQSAIAMCKNPQFHGKSKHIAIKYHYIRELVDDGKLLVKYVSSDDNIADIFTKGSFTQHVFDTLASLLNMVEVRPKL